MEITPTIGTLELAYTVVAAFAFVGCLPLTYRAASDWWVRRKKKLNGITAPLVENTLIWRLFAQFVFFVLIGLGAVAMTTPSRGDGITLPGVIFGAMFIILVLAGVAAVARSLSNNREIEATIKKTSYKSRVK